MARHRLSDYPAAAATQRPTPHHPHAMAHLALTILTLLTITPHSLALPPPDFTMGRFGALGHPAHNSTLLYMTELPAADGGYGPFRRLMHGSHVWATTPRCSRCNLFRCSGNFIYGHCKANGLLYTCFVRKGQSGSTSTILRRRQRRLQTLTFGESGGDFTSNNQPPTPPAPPPPPPAPVENLTDTAPFAACFADSDCAFSESLFTAVDGETPLAVDGRLASQCELQAIVSDPRFTDFPGICTCFFVHPAAPSTARLQAESLARDGLLTRERLEAEAAAGTNLGTFVSADFCEQVCFR